MIRFSALMAAVVILGLASPAAACFFNEPRAKADMDRAFFVGTVKVVDVEPATATRPGPRVTYEILETTRGNRQPGSKIAIDQINLTSCDNNGPWAVGDTSREAFFMQDGRAHAATVDMRIFLVQ